MKYRPHDYQEYASEKIIELPETGLFLDMGLGKTVTTLTAIDELMFDRFEVSRVLVIAPKRVAEDTWTTETEKWDHLQHLKISRVLGTQKDRICRPDWDSHAQRIIGSLAPDVSDRQRRTAGKDHIQL